MAFVLVALFWNATMIGWYCTTEIKWDELTMDVAFPLVFVGIGIFLAYSCIGALLNTTEMEISPDLLRVTTEPVPWHREIRLVPAEIRDVIYRERASKGYASTYDLVAVMADGAEKRLFGGFLSYEVVVFYVRELRSILNLPDVTLSPDA